MNDAPHQGAARRIWAAVPFRGPVGSKRRLAGLLSPAEREQLSLSMLVHVLAILHESAGVERILVLTSPGTTVDWPAYPRLTVVEEPAHAGGDQREDGLNSALRHAQRLASADGVDGLLIVPADLPLVSAADITAVLEAGASVAVVIAPDRHRLGTNALLMSPPDAVAPAFGEDSFLRHSQAAKSAVLSTQPVDRTGLMIDLDTPDDLRPLLDASDGGRVARLLREFDVAGRLESRQARSTTI